MAGNRLANPKTDIRMPRDELPVFNGVIGMWLVLLLSLSACGRKVEVKSQVSELEKAFPGAASAAAPAQPEASAQAAPAPDPNTFVQAALVAVRTNDYVAGVIALQNAQQSPGVTAQQLMAVEKAKQALTAELLARADRGDPQAKAALAAIEKTRSQ